MSITLNKNRSGIWSLPEKAGDLKVWQRLWVATGIMYFFMVVATGYVLMPTRGAQDRTMVFAVTEEVRKYEGLVFAGDSPEKIFERARSQGYSMWIAGLRKKYRIGREGDAGFSRIEKEYHQDIESLPLKQLKLSALLWLAWIVPMGVLYALGYLVDWINKGES
jgi:hypothetical protein